MSFDLILPFLRPIAPFIEDPDVSEIMVNAGGRVFLADIGMPALLFSTARASLEAVYRIADLVELV